MASEVEDRLLADLALVLEAVAAWEVVTGASLLPDLPQAEVEDLQPEGVLPELRPPVCSPVAAEVVAGCCHLLPLLLLLVLDRRRPLGRRRRRLSSAEQTRRCRGEGRRRGAEGR